LFPPYVLARTLELYQKPPKDNLLNQASPKITIICKNKTIIEEKCPDENIELDTIKELEMKEDSGNDDDQQQDNDIDVSFCVPKFGRRRFFLRERSEKI